MIFRTRLLPAAALLAAAAPAAAQRVPGIAVRAQNTLAIERHDETLSFGWDALVRQLPALRPNLVRAVDATGVEVPVQVLDGDGDGRPDSLLVQQSFFPGETRELTIQTAAPAQKAATRVHAAYNTWRDDVAWENDRIAFRTYGMGLLKLEPTTITSGIDVWPKRTRAMVLDRWYEEDEQKRGTYHVDRGEGADLYNVGRTLGAAGTAIWKDGKLFRATNFRSHRILADGPIRGLIEVTYDAWDAAGTPVTETKRITMDAGSNLYRSESVFRFDGAPLTLAMGTVKRPFLVGSTSADQDWAWMSTWGPLEQAAHGTGDMGTAIILPKSRLAGNQETPDHFLALTQIQSGVPIVFYAGAGWTSSRDFADAEAWWSYLRDSAARLATPIKLTVGTGA
ncbi:MAG TPA: DUF4861 family protein [Longimicrobiaceae bacterium]|jgi:pectinesterase|nr:DUF4861 family protein [Longimicrobiaceae bacterium]